MTSGRKGIRGGTRIPLELPVLIQWRTQTGTERQAEGKTGSISGNGLFILAPVRLRHDTHIQLTVALPTELTNTPMQLHCKGRVVHRHKTGTMAGLGVVIDDYRFAATMRPA